MALLEQLKADQGTISSTLDNALAERVLNGDTELLRQAVALTRYEPEELAARNVRIGAARIVERVAENRPELVAPYLQDLLPALETPEPQTKWLLLVTLGYCAKQNPAMAIQGMDYAHKFIHEKPGLGVAGASEKYLGYIGALSPNLAQDILPLLLYALDKAETNELNWVFDALIQIWDNLQRPDKAVVVNCAKPYLRTAKPSTIQKVEKLITMAKAA